MGHNVTRNKRIFGRILILPIIVNSYLYCIEPCVNIWVAGRDTKLKKWVGIKSQRKRSISVLWGYLGYSGSQTILHLLGDKVLHNLLYLQCVEMDRCCYVVIVWRWVYFIFSGVVTTLDISQM